MPSIPLSLTYNRVQYEGDAIPVYESGTTTIHNKFHLYLNTEGASITNYIGILKRSKDGWHLSNKEIKQELIDIIGDCILKCLE